ncbi:MAG: CbtA family protein [Jatrophihabitantaceae bacterium]
MTRTYLVRGMLVGVLAALLALVFAKVFGEPWVGRAISFESARDAAAGGPNGPQPVSRTVQSTLGLGVGVLVYGAVLGGLYGLVCAVSQGRLGSLRARGSAALVAALGFVSLGLVPFLKYPPNPPSIGNADTLDKRTVLYFAIIAAAVVLTVGCVVLWHWLVARHDAWTAALASLGVFVIVIALAMVALPGFNEVPKDFPADVLFRFRIASLGIQVVLWTTLGLGFGWVIHRRLTDASARQTSKPDVNPPVAG